MTTTTDKTYLISNDQHVGTLPADGIYELSWILFAEIPAIESGFDLTDSRIEVYKYIRGTGVGFTKTKSKVVNVDEARAEWRFWIGQGFQRITDKENKGWKYTEDIRQRCGIKKMTSGVKIKPMEKEIA